MSDNVLRIALRLHPAGYRREMAAELATVFADSTAGAGRWATGRELLDLAAHGLRLRLGLGSAGALGRAAGLAAPFAAGTVAAGVAYTLSWSLWSRDANGYHLAHSLSFGGTDQYGAIVSVLAVLSALFGRWTAARLLAPVSVLVALWTFVSDETAYPPLHLTAYTATNFGPRLLWLLILLAAPRDLLGPRSWRGALQVGAGLVVGSVLFSETSGFWPVDFVRPVLEGPGFALVLFTAELTLLLLARSALQRGQYGPAGAALAGAPVLLLVLVLAAGQLWKDFLPTVLVMLGVVAAALLAARRLSPTVGTGGQRPPTAG
ncbi:hypothetical protein ABT095_09520 [Kitasatospora sp. NPDC002227]|uniref:hypothetical protein n=1 Tax=Kitasatospora sp. NPDC002227 TaxID=3154773 RepID=UPI00331F5345